MLLFSASLYSRQHFEKVIWQNGALFVSSKKKVEGWKTINQFHNQNGDRSAHWRPQTVVCETPLEKPMLKDLNSHFIPSWWSCLRWSCSRWSCTRWKLGQNHRRRPTSPKEDVSYQIVISLSQKEDKKTATTTSAVQTWTAFRYSGRSWARQLFDPTGALLATLTGALHRGCTAAPTPKLLPARGRVQGFMEAYWTNFLEEFNFCLPDDGSWKNLHSVKFGCLKRCLWWGVSVIIVDKRNQKLISCKTNLKHKDTLTSSGSFVLENPTTFYQTHCCCTGCFIQLTIFQQNEKSSGIFLLLLKSVFGCISSVFTQIYPVFVSLLSILLQHTLYVVAG